MTTEQRPSRDEAKQGLSVSIGQETRVVVGWGVRFLRARGGGELRPTRVTSPFEAKVVGKLARWGKRPPPDDLVTLEVPNGAQRVTLRSDAGTVDVPMNGKRSQKQLLFWHGAAGDLGGAAWDDVQLIEVTASGDVPFTPVLEAEADGDKGSLGLIDILVEDPEGRKRTLRSGLVKTRTPKLTFVLPNVDAAALDLYLDDGDDATEDEVNLTAYLALEGAVTTKELPTWVRLNRSAVRGTVNEPADGRQRMVVPDEEEPPAEGDCALFLFGPNRLRVEDHGEPLFSACSCHYESDDLEVPPGQQLPVTVSFEGKDLVVAARSLIFDFADGLDDAAISQALAALGMAPTGFSGTYNIVEAIALGPLEPDALPGKKTEVEGLGDPDITDVAFAVLAQRCDVRLERLPEPIHRDYVAASRTFANADVHWHHFVIHTFPAHRLIESQIFPSRRPPVQALAGVNFDTRKTFLLPAGAGDLHHIRQLIDAEPSGKVALFGHTDTQGPDADNDELSLLRAQSLQAVLRHDVGWWFDRFAQRDELVGPGRPELKYALRETGDYAGPIDDSESPALTSALASARGRLGVGGSGVTQALRRAIARDVRTKIGAAGVRLTQETAWGTIELQHMLATTHHDPGPVTGVMTPATRQAIRAFQASQGLTADGDVGLCTRIALIQAYFVELVPNLVPEDRFHAGAVFGCGEAFPAITTGDNVASPVNRRVEAMLRRNPVTPIDPSRRGAQVPYLEWKAPEFDGDTPPEPPTVVVAVADTGVGGGAADNFRLNEQLTLPNHLFVRGDRWVRPTNTSGAVGGNVNNAVVARDGDLTVTNDTFSPANGGFGHGTAVALSLGGDGVGNTIAGATRRSTQVVLGTAPHVKIRPISTNTAAGTGSFFAAMLGYRIIADDPDVKVYTSSSVFYNFNTFTAQQQRAVQERVQAITTRGKIICGAAANYHPIAPGVYHSSTCHWGFLAGQRTASRSTFTGANIHQKNLLIVGATDRVGNPTAPNALTNAPGMHETGTDFTFLGEQVAVHMPGRDIRVAVPLTSNMSVQGLTSSTPQGADLIGGIDGTSFSTPMTAGVAAELMLLDPALRSGDGVTRVIEYIVATADVLPRLAANVGSAGWPGPPLRVNDPTIAGNANHAAFFGIRRVNYWKAVLAASNQGLAVENHSGAAGGPDNFYTTCTLKDEAATTWYGFELRVPIPDAVVWFQRTDGSYVLAEDGGAVMPGGRILASNWIRTDTYQAMAPAGSSAVGSAAENMPLPVFPWPQGAFVGGRLAYYLCQLSVKRAELERYKALVVHLAGTDPRGATPIPPILSLPLDRRGAMRVPGTAGGVVQTFVEAFRDFVFHVTVAPQAVDHYVLVAEGGRTAVGVAEGIDVVIYAVDAFGQLTTPAAPIAGMVTHDGTAGTVVPGAGVYFDGFPSPQAGRAMTRNAGDPNGVGRIRFADFTAETVTLRYQDGAGKSGTLAMTVAAAGAMASFRLEVRRRGGGAALSATPPVAGELLEVVVTAVDAGGRTATGFTGQVELSLLSGQPGRDGPPHPTGVHVANAIDDPYSAAAFRYQMVAGDAGVHAFPLIVYTTGTVKLRATSGAGQGDSAEIAVGAAPVATFRVQTTSPQSTGTTFQVSVTAVDRWDNVAENFTGVVRLERAAGTVGSRTPNAGVIIGDTTLANDDTHEYLHADGGVHQFPVTCYTAEDVTLRAVWGAINGSSPPITIQGAGPLDHFRFEIRGADRAGSAFSCKVIAEDAQNHRIPTFGGQVTLSLAQGTPFAAGRGVQITGSPHTYGAVENGEFTFTVTPNTAEQVQLQAASGGVTSTSAVLTITGGAMTAFNIVPAAGLTHNVPSTVQVSAVDGAGNTVTNFLGTVTLTAQIGWGGAPVALGNHTFVLADSGTFTFPVTLTSAAPNYIILASDGNVTSQTGNVAVA